MPSVVSVVGPSGSGKTTLIERVIRDISARGFSASAIKFAGCGFDPGDSGKDSFRLKSAGAVSVGIVSRSGWMVAADEPGLAFADLLAKLPPSDLVITEGGSRLDTPKIGMVPASPVQSPRPLPDGDLVALVGENLRHEHLPCFHRDDISGISGFLIRRYVKTAGRKS